MMSVTDTYYIYVVDASYMHLVQCELLLCSIWLVLVTRLVISHPSDLHLMSPVHCHVLEYQHVYLIL